MLSPWQPCGRRRLLFLNSQSLNVISEAAEIISLDDSNIAASAIITLLDGVAGAWEDDDFHLHAAMWPLKIKRGSKWRWSWPSATAFRNPSLIACEKEIKGFDINRMNSVLPALPWHVAVICALLTPVSRTVESFLIIAFLPILHQQL